MCDWGSVPRPMDGAAGWTLSTSAFEHGVGHVAASQTLDGHAPTKGEMWLGPWAARHSVSFAGYGSPLADRLGGSSGGRTWAGPESDDSRGPRIFLTMTARSRTGRARGVSPPPGGQSSSVGRRGMPSTASQSASWIIVW